MSIRVVVAGDHRILREALCGLLASHTDVELAGVAIDEESVLTLCRTVRPDVVLLQADMSNASCVDLTRRIRSEIPSVKVIAHSAAPGRGVLGAMLRAGASGYLDRESGGDALMDAVRGVAAGRPYLGNVAADSLIEEFAQNAPAASEPAPAHRRPAAELLTPREIEVLRLLATGKRVKEIARLLDISVKTVESHRQNMMDKLEIHNAIELARYALREGLASV